MSSTFENEYDLSGTIYDTPEPKSPLSGILGSLMYAIGGAAIVTSAWLFYKESDSRAVKNGWADAAGRPLVVIRKQKIPPERIDRPFILLKDRRLWTIYLRDPEGRDDWSKVIVEADRGDAIHLPLAPGESPP